MDPHRLIQKVCQKYVNGFMMIIVSWKWVNTKRSLHSITIIPQNIAYHARVNWISAHENRNEIVSGKLFMQIFLNDIVR